MFKPAKDRAEDPTKLSMVSPEFNRPRHNDMTAVVADDGNRVNGVSRDLCEANRRYEYARKGQDNGSRHEAFHVFYGGLSKHG